MQASLLKAVPFSPSFTVFTCPNRVLSGDPALRKALPAAGQSHYRPHSCRTACYWLNPTPHAITVYASQPYPATLATKRTLLLNLDRSCTGRIAPALPSALTQTPWRGRAKSAGFRVREIGSSLALCGGLPAWQAARSGCRRNQHQKS